MGNAAVNAVPFARGLPPGISGTNDRCTIIVSNLNPDVSFYFLKALSFLFLLWAVCGNKLPITSLNILNFLLTINFMVSQKVDEDKLFNLFSLYGNIMRIKILRNKVDHALVQMGDGFQAELAVNFLKVWSLQSLYSIFPLVLSC